MSHIVCPYCCQESMFKKNNCENCGTDLSPTFIKNARINPPNWLVTVGFSQVGKSTYVEGLSVILEYIGKISEDAYNDYLDDYTFTYIQNTRRLVREGVLPQSTNRTDSPQPLLISLNNFMGTRPRSLVMYDMAGEIFNNRNEIQDYAKPLTVASTVWFFVSVGDLREDAEGRSLADLFNVYRTGMERLGIRTKGRNLIIIYTKADRTMGELPSTVQRYLQTDPYVSLHSVSGRQLREEGHLFDEDAYYANLNRVSTDLREYTADTVEGGGRFVNMVRDSGMNLYFTVISALGSQAIDRKMPTDFRRYRVIDPLLWALRLSEKPISSARSQSSDHDTSGKQGVALIIDAHQDSAGIYEQNIPQAFYEALAARGKVVTYYMGSNAPNRQAPTNTPPKRNRSRLIGPILERLPKHVRAVVLMHDVPQDLFDFYESEWYKRIYLVELGVEHRDLRWKNKAAFSMDDDNPETFLGFLFGENQEEEDDFDF